MGRADAGALPTWEPGAHIDVFVGDGLVRQYSLCGDPRDADRWRIAVLRAPASRGGSVALHESVSVGDSLRVSVPRNHFELRPAPRYLFVAGGIGITPILPMVHAAATAGTDWRLWYGGRSRESMAFADELSAAFGSRVELWPENERGLLPVAELLGRPDRGTLVYCCGPEPLLTACELYTRPWPAGTLRLERFTPHAPFVTGADEFEIELASSKKVLKVPADRSMLQVMLDAGIDVDHSCREGVCGTCETTVLAGLPEHRDSVLTDTERAENTSMFVCVSRARSERLVLDL
ncbi:PDR/VanB family oxidoreductase [Amycolatopsis sp. NPDC005232]|uniref:PDR/VanB family oxidoreductase n=1 Tax=Amycolatopsis sp. NPDC005232 TaxID=3157027 RepID=UPI0033BC3342